MEIGPLAAVRVIGGAWSYSEIGEARQIPPPEDLRGGGTGIPFLPALENRLELAASTNEVARLAPRPYLRQVMKVPSIADRAMVARRGAQEHVSLGCAGYGW